MNLALCPNGQHMGLCWPEWQEFLKIQAEGEREEGEERGRGGGEGRGKGG